MLFKTYRQEDEFNRIDDRLKILLLAVDGYSRNAFGKEIIVTHLLRTQEEQDRIYGNNPKYKKKPWKSVHQFGRGADIRTHHYTDEEIEQLVRWVNEHFIYGRYKPTALYHDVGYGEHIHLQVPDGVWLVK